ncbi:MAG TPA: sigma-70 family RNA polymerase sigma factor [Candidatus Angelobacter sp.]|jgi:RNA polymerase sigma factor (sigma-70 family)
MATQIPDTYFFHALYVQELEKGNTATTDHFVSYFRPRLRSFLRKRGVPTDSVEDIQQETFARVLAVLQSKGIRHPERLGGFVNAVCRNTLFESYRNTQRYVEIDDSIDEMANTGLNPVALLLKAEAAALVRRVLSRLSSRHQKLLHGLYIEQKSKDEICEQLGVSIGHLRLLLYRAKRQFVNRMNKNELRHFQRYMIEPSLRNKRYV